jgi:hypothetical protein
MMITVYGGNLITLVLVIGVLMGIATIGYYIPPQFVIILSAIVLLGVYATLLMVFVATHTDPYMTAYFIGFITLFWYTCVRLRQPFN